MRIWKLCLILMVNLSWLPIAHAADVHSSVSNSVVAVNQAIELLVSIDQRVPADVIDFDELNTDFMVGRPNVSSSYQNINGKTSIKTEWRVAIAPKRVGTVIIPAFDIDGHKTQPIKLDVKKGVQDAQNARQKKDIFIESNLDRDELYVGETTQLHLTIYLGVELQNARIQPPKGEGVEIKQLGTDKQYRTQISGRNYMGVDVTYQVTPTKPGKLNINGAVLSGEKVKRKGSYFNDPVLTIPTEVSAKDIEVQVLAKPEGYSDLWLPTEHLSITQSWQPDLSGINGNELKVGSPIERNIELRAVGVDVLKMPKIKLNYPASVKVYDEKPEFSIDGDETVMRLKQVIIPRYLGEVTLEGLDIAWFNSRTHQPEKAHIDGLTFQAIADPELVTNAPPVSVTPIQPKKPVVAPEEVVSSAPKPMEASHSSLFWIMSTLGFALLWLVTLFFYIRKNTPLDKVKSQEVMPTDELDIKYCKQLITNGEDITLVQYLNQLDLSSYSQEIEVGIKDELMLLQASRYSQESNEWDSTKLLELLCRLNKETRKSQTTNLAEL